MEKLDFKKAYKNLYLPKTAPMILDVPQMSFIMVDGKGNPNEENGSFQKAVELLYALSYTIKMSKMGKSVPEGYFEYVVPPLEGLWWFENGAPFDFTQKEQFCWTAMIRQPDFVTDAVFAWACAEVKEKKQLDVSTAHFEAFTEGLCVQCMHIGSYDKEPETVEKMMRFMEANALKNDIGPTRHHHEIYLSDPRKADPAKWKTVLRYPVKAQGA